MAFIRDLDFISVFSFRIGVSELALPLDAVGGIAALAVEQAVKQAVEQVAEQVAAPPIPIQQLLGLPITTAPGLKPVQLKLRQGRTWMDVRIDQPGEIMELALERLALLPPLFGRTHPNLPVWAVYYAPDGHFIFLIDPDKQAQ